MKQESTLSVAEKILTQGAVLKGQPVPWNETHDSIETMTWDGRVWLHKGLAKTPMQEGWDG